MKFMGNMKKLRTVNVYQHVIPIWLRDGNYPRKYRFIDYAEIVSRRRTWKNGDYPVQDTLKHGTWDYK